MPKIESIHKNSNITASSKKLVLLKQNFTRGLRRS